MKNVFSDIQRALLLLFAVFAVPAQAAQVWYEHGLATTVSGYSPQFKAYQHRKFYLVAMGPDEVPAARHEAVRRCSRQTLTLVGAELGSTLKSATLVSLTTAPATLDAAKDAVTAKARDSGVDKAINQATARFRKEFVSCAGRQLDTKAFHLAIVQRMCEAGLRNCSNTPVAFADHPSARAFTALSLWIDARDNKTRTLAANVPVLLPDLVDASVVLKTFEVKEPDEALKKCREDALKATPAAGRRPLACQALELASRPFKESNSSLWREPPTGPAAQAELEALVARARQTNKLIERNVIRMHDLPREIAVQVLDVVDEPQQAILELREDAKAKLVTIQDEVARLRLKECAMFQGGTTLAAVSKCAGYKIDQGALDVCLRNQECRPERLNEVSAAALAVSLKSARDSLARAAELPRLQQSYAKVEAAVQACAKQASKALAAKCVAEATLGEKERAALACVSNASGKALSNKETNCALQKVMGPAAAEAERLASCVSAQGNARDKVICSLQGKVPKEAQVFLECRDKHPTDNRQMALCTAQRAGGEVSTVLACANSSNGDWKEGLKCYAGTKVPASALTAVECVQSSNSIGGFAGCAAKENLPKELQRPAQCIAQSGGNPLGAGVCMAGDDLTPDQRIALQCLASTGGEPASFATCALGQLAMKELFNCVDKKLFEGNCMGPNNDLVKFAKALGIDLKPSTVVGQVLNATLLEPIKVSVAIAQAVLGGVEDLGRNLEREVARAGENIGRELSKGAGDVVSGRFGQNVAREAGNVIRDLGRALRIRW